MPYREGVLPSPSNTILQHFFYAKTTRLSVFIAEVNQFSFSTTKLYAFALVALHLMQNSSKVTRSTNSLKKYIK